MVTDKYLKAALEVFSDGSPKNGIQFVRAINQNLDGEEPIFPKETGRVKRLFFMPLMLWRNAAYFSRRTDPGTHYANILNMERNGYISSRPAPSTQSPRRHWIYDITDQGRAKLEELRK